MTNSNDLIQEKGNEGIDFYKNALKDFVMDNQLTPRIKDFDLDKYIAVFSLYMHYNNDAYRYNLPYLSYQHKKFEAFLVSASSKCELLRNITESIRNSAVIQQFVKESFQEAATVKICLNDFLVLDLMGTISFHERFSFPGAERNSKDDVLTVLCNDRAWSCKVPANIKSTAQNKYSPIVKMVEKALGLDKEEIGGVTEDA